MLINWYPGHMNKARKKVKEIMPTVDVVIEVLDARLPYSSTNPMLESLRGDKPYLKVLSKSDLADDAITQQWLGFMNEQKNTEVLSVTTQQPGVARTIPTRVVKMVPKHNFRLRPINALILGIPNVGKSTLINTLVGKKLANVGNEPAITKGQQKIKLSDSLALIDSPGMTWPGSKDIMVNYRLAASGAIRDTAIEYDDLGLFAVDYMLQRYPSNISDHFSISPLASTAYEVLQQIAQRRGCVQKGKIDLIRAGELFIRELRAGKMGRVSFEEPYVSYHIRD